MSERINNLERAIKKAQGEAKEILAQVVNVNSYAYNKAGVEKVAEIFRERFEALGFSSSIFPRDCVGDITLLSNKASLESDGKGGVLLNAHLDTVFEPEKPLVPFFQSDGFLRGHGVSDDKGGALIIYQAIRALYDIGLLNDIPIRILFNTDEEQGSDYSKDIIMHEASKADLVIVAEYGKPQPQGATIVTRRLGRGKINVLIEGDDSELCMLEIIEKACYLGSPDNDRIIRIRNYKTDKKEASATIIYGFSSMAEGEKMKKTLEQIVRLTASEFKVAKTLSGEITRPPLIFTENRWKMFERARQIGREIGFNLTPESRISCSDASFVPDYIPVLDGMGPIGDKIHTDEEFMLAQSLSVRPLIIAELMASTIS